MKSFLKKFIKLVLPKPWLERLIFFIYSSNDRRYWWMTGIDKSRIDRVNLERHDIQEGCFIEAYWVDRISGDGNPDFGPVAILVVHGSEILKFDCYGMPHGHFHIATSYPKGIRNGLYGRIWLPEQTVEDQIDRSIFELKHNLKVYLQKHSRKKVRNTNVNAQKLGLACEWMKAKMMEDLKENRTSLARFDLQEGCFLDSFWID